MAEEKQKGSEVKALNLWEKMNLVRIEVYSDPENMTPDKVNTGNGQKFISGAKLRRVVAPLWAKYGIETVYRCLQPEALPPIKIGDAVKRSQHYMAGCELTLINIHAPTERETFAGWGEGADAMDKSISIAQSYAMRNVILNSLQIVDGMEMEDVPEFALPNLGGEEKYIPKTEEEKDEARSKILAKEVEDAKEVKKAVETPKTVETPKKVEVPKEVPKTEVPKKKVVLEVKKTEETPQTTLVAKEEPQKVSKPVEKTEEASKPVSSPMTPIQVQAFEVSKKKVQELILADRLTPEEIRSIGEFTSAVKDSATFKSFQTAYKMLTQDVAKRCGQ